MPQPRPRILVVDDDPLIGRAIVRSLCEGYEVATVTDAREALAQLQSGERFSAILCDLMMPEMTGMDFHSTLLGQDPAMARRIIFLTGGSFTQRMEAFLVNAAIPRVEKPFSTPELVAAIESITRSG